MDCKLPGKYHPVYGYKIRLITWDNLKVFNRGRTVEEIYIHKEINFYDYNVHIFIDKRFSSNIVLPFNVKLKYKPIYIGKGVFYPDKIENSRACQHHDDLLSKIISDESDYYECWMFGNGITQNEASCLEALWIKYLVTECNYNLSDENIGDLINKRRELKWESRMNKILKMENAWK